MGRNNRNKRAPKQPPHTATTKNVKGAHKSASASATSPAALAAAGTGAASPLAATNQLISEKNKVELISKDYQETLEGDLSCAICQDIYINPLMLNCSHSFCKFCVVRWLSKQTGCPQCRMKVTFQGENLALRNIINKMVQKSTDDFRENRTKNVNQRLIDEAAQDKEGLLLSISKRQDSQPRTPRYRFVRPIQEGSRRVRVMNRQREDDDNNDEDDDDNDDADYTVDMNEDDELDSVDTDELIHESLADLATHFANEHSPSQQQHSRTTPNESSFLAIGRPNLNANRSPNPSASRHRDSSVRQFILSEAEEDNEEEEEQGMEDEDDDEDSGSDDDSDIIQEEEEADSYDEEEDEDFAPQHDEDREDTSESSDSDSDSERESDSDDSADSDNSQTRPDSDSETDFTVYLQGQDEGAVSANRSNVSPTSFSLPSRSSSPVNSDDDDDEDDYFWNYFRPGYREEFRSRQVSQNLSCSPQGRIRPCISNLLSACTSDSELRYSAESTVEYATSSDDDLYW